MDAADPLALTRPTKPALSASTSLRRTRSRAQTSPKRLPGKDGTTRRVSPLLPSSTAKGAASAQKPTSTKWIAKTLTRGASTASKPLVPLSERRSHDEKKQRETESDKWDIAPDGGSAGREGRQFTVANVGNNGRIYLRYVRCDISPFPTLWTAKRDKESGGSPDKWSYLLPYLGVTVHDRNANLAILGLAFGQLTNGTPSQTLLFPSRHQAPPWLIVGTQPTKQSKKKPRKGTIARVIFKQRNGPQQRARHHLLVTGTT